ncbi:flagellar basal-body MS-ring/collar protein FliF [Pararobbsia alpina]|uniref:Flagellar M-ring protein n=1 Tax=Pararobbsia alpina TaxID=621374 RepID=A0A6S7AUP0_9BURK|nr:flagellar basal-body MS-ring/collar protein FliF [Pararobbsia alpina]CAB3778494.1 Flagellar M-ring protein [Pararobbsia alpina]
MNAATTPTPSAMTAPGAGNAVAAPAPAPAPVASPVPSTNPTIAALEQRMPFIGQLRTNPRLPVMLVGALLIAVLAALYLWSRAPDYKVLYSNLSDRDGGAIITALQTMNVPYKFTDAGGAILVPADQVHETRLRLAQQGLPKGGSVGFELMDNEKFGISQFAEQVNYQRALEGELERTINALSAVSDSRVHLAIPKPTVFVSEKQNPTASVMINLWPGRVLDEGQVAAITHMVSSAVPDMPAKNVTIVDQNGNLLTAPTVGNGLDATQLKYVAQIQEDTQRRIDAILAPLFGEGNVHSQVAADIDFSKIEQSSEQYTPNETPKDSAIRSQQTSESKEIGQTPSGGVPGALSNTPPQPASAPLVNPTPASGATAAGTNLGPSSEHKDTTTNYELDKTVRHVEQPQGQVRRLTAAVLVNYKPTVDAKGHVTMQPLSAAQLAQVKQLASDAMGFNSQRGDSLNVVNGEFSTGVKSPDLPFWKQPETLNLATTGGKYVLMAMVFLVLFFGVLRPWMKGRLNPVNPADSEAAAVAALEGPTTSEGKLVDADGNLVAAIGENAALGAPVMTSFERNLTYARQVAKSDPKAVATVIKNWVNDER